jgi:hypothetical protein
MYYNFHYHQFNNIIYDNRRDNDGIEDNDNDHNDCMGEYSCD